MPEKVYVFVLKLYAGGDYIQIERHVVQSETEKCVTLRHHLRPAGETVPRAQVLATWDEAVAAYWQCQKMTLAKKRREVRTLERKIKIRKEPRPLKGGY